jgi:hypothetical protein
MRYWHILTGSIVTFSPLVPKCIWLALARGADFFFNVTKIFTTWCNILDGVLDVRKMMEENYHTSTYRTKTINKSLYKRTLNFHSERTRRPYQHAAASSSLAATLLLLVLLQLAAAVAPAATATAASSSQQQHQRQQPAWLLLLRLAVGCCCAHTWTCMHEPASPSGCCISTQL